MLEARWAATRARGLAALLLAVGLVVFGAGCGGGDGDDGTEDADRQTTAAQRPVTTVGMDEYEFEPSDVTVKRGTTITVENRGKVSHNLTIEDGGSKVAGTSTFPPPKSEDIEVRLRRRKYEIVCTVPGHERLGMKGTLTVE